MTSIRRLTAMLLALLLACSVLPAAAQDDRAQLSPFGNPNDYVGLEAAASRTWSADFATLSEEAIADGAEGDDPLAGLSSLFYIGGIVFEFDGDASAESAFGTMRPQGDDFTPDAFGYPDGELSTETLSNFGDRAFVVRLEFEDPSFSGVAVYSFAQAGEHIFLVSAIASDLESSSIAFDLLEHLVEEDGDQSGLGDFDASGTSSGGLWEFFPGDDQDLLSGLIVVQDEILYPEQDDQSN